MLQAILNNIKVTFYPILTVEPDGMMHVLAAIKDEGQFYRLYSSNMTMMDALIELRKGQTISVEGVGKQRFWRNKNGYAAGCTVITVDKLTTYQECIRANSSSDNLQTKFQFLKYAYNYGEDIRKVDLRCSLRDLEYMLRETYDTLCPGASFEEVKFIRDEVNEKLKKKVEKEREDITPAVADLLKKSSVVGRLRRRIEKNSAERRKRMLSSFF